MRKELVMKNEFRQNQPISWIGATAIAIAMSGAIHSSAATHYVSQTSPNPTPPYSTPDTAAHNIQSAIDVTTDGDTVLVAPGDYGVTNQITVTNAIRLQSTGGASQTFLTGYGGPGTWCIAISNALAVADGFTVRPATPTPGYPGGAVLSGGTIYNCNFTNFYVGIPNFGGSIEISGGTVSNVIVAYKRGINSDGAAVLCSDSGLVIDSQILAIPGVNIDGGAVALVNSRLQNSIVSGLRSPGKIYGPAVSAISSTVVGCTISNNYSLGRGGAYLKDSLMDRCIVTANTVGNTALGSGGGGVFETNSIIRNSLIVSNESVIGDGGAVYGGLGAGVYMQGGALLNCTVTGNFAHEAPSLPGGGGGVFAESGGITNCIIYFNWVDLDRPSSNWFNFGSAVFDHCCTTPAPGGAGNFTQDPQFVDIAIGNFHLASTSPCIGTGVVQPWMTGAQDLDGNPRTTNGRVDRGAYQNRPSSILSITRSGSNVLLRWPSVGTAELTLQTSLDVNMPECWVVTDATVTDDGTNKFVTLLATNSAQFFRLR